MEAGIREREWFAERPELLREHEQAQEAEARRREEEGYDQLASTRPATFDDYRDLEWRERLARFWVLVVILLQLACAALEIAHLGVLGNVAQGDYLDSLDVAESNDRLAIVYLVTFAGYLLSGGFFIAWTWRAYKNAAALGAHQLRFGPGWAIGGWLVPFLNLWRPRQIVGDIWRTTEPQAPAYFRRVNWSAVREPGLLSAWWGLFVVSSVLDRVSARIAINSTALEDDRTGTIFGLLASVTMAAAGVLAILVIRGVTARQRERAAALEQLPAPASGAPQPAAA